MFHEKNPFDETKTQTSAGWVFSIYPPAVNLQLKDDLSLSRSSRAVDLAIEAGLSRLPGGNPNLEGGYPFSTLSCLGPWPRPLVP